MIFSNTEIPAETARSVAMAVKTDRLPQSILLSGGSKGLRDKCAAELCAAVLCKNPSSENGEPCGQCISCKKVMSGIHPDVIRVTPEDGKKNLQIERVRELVLRSLYVSANESDNKVYLIENGDELSAQIQNTLLKTIEEPPPNVMFIICCEKRENLIVTVISRLTEYRLGDTLSSESENDSEALAIAKDIAMAVTSGDEFSIMMKCAPMNKNRKLMSNTAAALIMIIRDALCCESETANASGAEIEAYALRRCFDNTVLLNMKTAMDGIISDAASNANENLLISRFSSQLAFISKKRN